MNSGASSKKGSPLHITRNTSGGVMVTTGSGVSFNPKHKLILAFVTGKISQENADQLIKQTKEKSGGSLHIFFSDWRPYYSEAILKFFGQPAQPERKGMRGHCPKP